jgi:hypothetical protein
MKATRSFETSETTHPTTQRYAPDDCDIRIMRFLLVPPCRVLCGCRRCGGTCLSDIFQLEAEFPVTACVSLLACLRHILTVEQFGQFLRNYVDVVHSEHSVLQSRNQL